MKLKGWSLGLTITGLVLVVFSLAWLLAIFPAMVKLPADYNKVVNFEGTYMVMNPDTQALEELPVCVEREQLAADVQDNVLIIDETVCCTHALAGMELPQFGAFGELGVDRSTREYVPGYGDMERTGQFCFPSDLEEQSYSMWISSAGRPLQAEFIGEEDFHDLKVFAFEISEQDLDIGTQEGTGLPQVLDIAISLKAEPVSGTTVYTESNSTYSIVPGPDMKVPYYISSISFTEDTIADLVDTASDARSLILWLSFYAFWIVIGVGAALVIAGAVMAVRTREY
jgi:hypothetical protein